MARRAKVFGYITYSFRDKDPVIDQLRTACELDGRHWKEIAAAAGVSPSTIYNWFQGDTLRPRFSTVMAIARALGGDFIYVHPKARITKLRA